MNSALAGLRRESIDNSCGELENIECVGCGYLTVEVCVGGNDLRLGEGVCSRAISDD